MAAEHDPEKGAICAPFSRGMFIVLDEKSIDPTPESIAGVFGLMCYFLVPTTMYKYMVCRPGLVRSLVTWCQKKDPQVKAIEQSVIEIFRDARPVDYRDAVVQVLAGGGDQAAFLKNQLAGADNMCAICMDDIGVDGLMLFPCHHILCKVCAPLVMTCPMCRAVIEALRPVDKINAGAADEKAKTLLPTLHLVSQDETKEFLIAQAKAVIASAVGRLSPKGQDKLDKIQELDHGLLLQVLLELLDARQVQSEETIAIIIAIAAVQDAAQLVQIIKHFQRKNGILRLGRVIKQMAGDMDKAWKCKELLAALKVKEITFSKAFQRFVLDAVSGMDPQPCLNLMNQDTRFWKDIVLRQCHAFAYVAKLRKKQPALAENLELIAANLAGNKAGGARGKKMKAGQEVIAPAEKLETTLGAFSKLMEAEDEAVFPFLLQNHGLFSRNMVHLLSTFPKYDKWLDFLGKTLPRLKSEQLLMLVHRLRTLKQAGPEVYMTSGRVLRWTNKHTSNIPVKLLEQIQELFFQHMAEKLQKQKSDVIKCVVLDERMQYQVGISRGKEFQVPKWAGPQCSNGSIIRVSVDQPLTLIIYWNEHTDLDLSGIGLTDDFQFNGTSCDYEKLVGDGGDMHTGDVVSPRAQLGSEKASERIRIPSLKKWSEKTGCKWYVVCTYSYGGQSFDDIDEAIVAIAFDDKKGSGPEGCTPIACRRLRGASKVNVSAIINAETGDVHLCNLNIQSKKLKVNSVAGSSNYIATVVEEYFRMMHQRPPLYVSDVGRLLPLCYKEIVLLGAEKHQYFRRPPELSPCKFLELVQEGKAGAPLPDKFVKLIQDEESKDDDIEPLLWFGGCSPANLPKGSIVCSSLTPGAGACLEVDALRCLTLGTLDRVLVKKKGKE